MSEEEKGAEDVCELLGVETQRELVDKIRLTHPRVLGDLLDDIRRIGNFTAQGVAHPDFREALKRIVLAGNDKLKALRKNSHSYLEDDPFLCVENKTLKNNELAITTEQIKEVLIDLVAGDTKWYCQCPPEVEGAQIVLLRQLGFGWGTAKKISLNLLYEEDIEELFEKIENKEDITLLKEWRDSD